MTVTPQITVSDGRLEVRGRTVLSGVPDNITAAHAAGAGLVDGAFVGATAGEAKSHHVFTFGTLRDCRFMCLFRFKLWWMTQRMGTSGRDVPLETQFILIEVPAAAGNDDGDSEPVYLVMLPLLEGQFRTVLQGNDQDQLQICIESGDKAVQTEQGMNSLYIHAGTNPFDTITQAVKAVEKHMQTFHHREKKKLPSFVDWFGWCTWDAFYTDVTADGVKQGLRSLAEGGVPPRFLIIDDGWQQIGSENKEDPGVAVQEGAQFASRLIGIKENTKFQSEHDQDDTPGLKRLVEETKKGHGVKSVYVWHAMAGYWGGVKPSAAGMEHYESALAYPVQSPGVTGNQPDIVMDSLSVLGLGLVHPRKVYNFYDELHAYLAACGVDGVKVDVQNIVETLGAGHGGRVALTRAYHRALEASVARNFPDNGCISCMCHNTDMLYSAKQTAVVRASDDFYPRDPASHTVHISSVAYNTLFLGEFMQPDWDMFHSLHPAAEYHGAARAIGGCPIYVSDKPGNHNFDLLKKLVLPDGSVLRAQLPGRPTRDCLFSDPARDGASLLKIWNMNKCAGVVGVFNCQGAGWCRIVKKTRIHDEAPGTLTGSVRAEDVEGIAQAAGTDDCTGDAVVYAYRAGELVRLPRGATLPVTLKRLEYELFHVCPIRTVAPDVSFAPIGLLHMFNAGGAVEECTVRPDEDDKAVVSLRVRGCGLFGAYCSRRPVKCSLDSGDVGFGYDADTGLVTVDVPVPEKEMYRWALEIRV
ncbi:probable galactinol--sucrose galactosyltransferase 2 [Triticum dicoccoides]|uniref:probable galactinol--sucrose galactosyltransferase 2 n=1 Tax=Triticum dicoccoides TaxID=85692 RepID=UPI000E7868B1|nr:probable galactinol--sucrose galactosyltransferase 2 [Triticum dicoccoides]XP_037404533.1 probable galactinol--sucrose galactosyltransferase 2 [Triticum dicoccoides]